MKTQMQAVALVAVFFCLVVFTGYAAVPSTINYQGRLLDNSGNPVEGITDVTFAIYDSPSGGTPLWSEVHEDLDVHRGFVIVSLGSENPIYRTVLDNTYSPTFLGIKINDDPEMVPRQEIESVPYALLSSGVSGDIETQPGEVVIRGDLLVTPTIDEHLLLNDLSVALVIDRALGDKDSTSLQADGLRIFNSDGTPSVSFTPGAVVFEGVPVDFAGTEATWLAGTFPIVIIDTTGVRLKYPSTNDAFRITRDDPFGMFRCDLDDDGLTDVSMASLPSKRLNLGSGVEFRCNGFASIGSCEITGTLDVLSSSTYEGSVTCLSDWSCDTDNDGTIDVSCNDTPSGPRLLFASGLELACDATARFANRIQFDVNNDFTADVTVMAFPIPELTVSPSTHFACDGMATFAQPVQVNSNLTVNGALLVTGPKAFVQEHPEDQSKEIVYVALEGNESGTYTRGSAQLKNGVAEIELPEDFRLVTNVEGLTVQITPRGPVNSMLYVESVTPTMLIVKASSKKDATINFDFMVNGVRKGFENHQVIRDKKSLAMNE